ncbi:uncharacterized protein AB675_12081 [Cyphellophora attinorum]|uniref:Small EDRK-rich factor-like N-terminal domain-containing protein n=1 Tax=Cyphellophora attinorum TaxID=1664694 RepID=A0A0N0NKW7_9EURO|nr:uncharacterized protein AB675_12081 [Phialophora attinorum]KPI38319.1 hypothetical protein AB675_12081 [Phialophora attinorum]
MTRGNQREKAREKNLAAQGAAKSKNTQSGTEFARTKEAQAAIMREKQAKAEAKAKEGGAAPKKK